jgi:uncharacterized protein YsxB (DUF464 family)
LISIEVELDSAGIVRSCRIEGHAGAAARGFDIVCAAVSVLARTFARALAGRRGVTAASSAPERGVFELAASYDEAGRDFLAGAGVFALEGFKSLAEEYPAFVSLVIRPSVREEDGFCPGAAGIP